MDFVTGILLLIDCKDDSYDVILIMVNQLIKMVYYKVLRTTIDTMGLTEVSINIIMRYHGLSELINSDQSSLFTSKFWSLLCYFLSIKRKLSTTFYPQTNSQTEKKQDNGRLSLSLCQLEAKKVGKALVYGGICLQ